MGEFFNGWRRKIGLAALLMALALMGGWVRSLNRCERFSFETNEYNYNWLGSFNASIAWQQVTPVDTLLWSQMYKKSGPMLFNEVAVATSEKAIADLLCGEDQFEWKHRYCGFAIGEFKQKFSLSAVHLTIWKLSYWSVVIPLTLLSAFLLLKKPRTSNQKKIIEPIPAEGN
jgi:hypothetical protein